MNYSPQLTIQWHITTACGNKCRHCYMSDPSTSQEEFTQTLNFQGLLDIFQSFIDFENKRGCGIPGFVLSGGDPLIREEWPELVKVIKSKGKFVSMMGNPETLTDENLRLLKQAGVSSFQMSLDGLEATHDSIRSPGSFKRTIEALGKLKAVGLKTAIMFTLFKDNCDQLIPLMRYLTERGQPDYFGFDLGCGIGGGKSMDNAFSPNHLQTIFRDYIKEKERLKNKNPGVTFIDKSNLLRLVHFENGDFKPRVSSTFRAIDGCLVGWSSVAVLSNGAVLPCRRLPLIVGKMPEQSFDDIFLGSELLRKFRRRTNFNQDCAQCDFFLYCRGCPAYTFGLTGDPLAKMPSCFRQDLPSTSPFDVQAETLEPAMQISNDQEFALLRSKFFYDPTYIKEKLKNDQNLQLAFITLNHKPSALDSFTCDPETFLRDIGVHLDEYSLILLKKYCEEMHGISSNLDRELFFAKQDKLDRMVTSHFFTRLFRTF